MRITECDALLSPAPLWLESGVERLPKGALHIAVRQMMEGCTGEMIQWWFDWGIDSEKYKWWHPGDHVFSRWDDGTPGGVVGSTHVIKERLASGPLTDIQLLYVDPAEAFAPGALAAAREKGDLSVALYGWGGIGDPPPKDERGRPNMTQYLGIGRDTPYGCVLRNHYWFGEAMDLPREALEQAMPDELGLALFRHDANEFYVLSKVIPPLYRGENWEKLGAPDPY